MRSNYKEFVSMLCNFLYVYINFNFIVNFYVFHFLTSWVKHYAKTQRLKLLVIK